MSDLDAYRAKFAQVERHVHHEVDGALNDFDTLARLWRWLDERGDAPEDVAYFLERREKWSHEMVEMLDEERRSGAPAA